MRRLLPILLVTVACARPEVPERDRPEPPQATLYGVRMEIFQGKRLLSSGRAAKVTYQRTTQDVVATEALLRFPARESGIRAPGGAASGLEVRTPTLLGNLGTRRAVAFDDVVGRTPQGLVGRTTRVHYDGRAGKAWGDEPASITGPGYYMRGDAFRADLALGDFEFEGNVESRLGAVP